MFAYARRELFRPAWKTTGHWLFHSICNLGVQRTASMEGTSSDCHLATVFPLQSKIMLGVKRFGELDSHILLP